MPVIRIFDSLAPQNVASGDASLCYPNLESHIEELELSNTARAQKVWEAPLGSAEEENAARQLAFEYLVRTAGKLVLTDSVDRRNLWTERYNDAASELFEMPDKAIVVDLIARHRQEVRSALGGSLKPSPATESLLATYDRLLPEGTEAQEANLAEAEIQNAIEDYKAELITRYGYVFELVETSGKQQFGPDDLKILFEEAVGALVEHGEEGWENWQVISKDSRVLSVNRFEKQIEIGKNRKKASTETARELLAHELLVHALRANNAIVAGNPLLLEGLVGYADAEEGLGKFAEHAISGKKPPTSADHYVDIGLASGVINGCQLNRHEVFELAIARKIVRAQMIGKYPSLNLSKLFEVTAASVDRIFYGTPGDTLPARQAVYISETNYYGGYRKILSYIVKAKAEGKSMAEIFTFVSQGKFDPTNPKHLSHVK